MPWGLRGQEVWQHFSRLAAKKLGKGADCTENWVALFKTRRRIWLRRSRRHQVRLSCMMLAAGSRATPG